MPKARSLHITEEVDALRKIRAHVAAQTATLEREVAELREQVDFAREIGSGLAAAMAEQEITLSDLREKWLAELYTYPDTSEGLHAATAVKLCVKELDAALTRATPSEEGKTL